MSVKITSTPIVDNLREFTSVEEGYTTHLTYALSRHPQRRRLQIRVNAKGEVEVAAPLRASLRAIDAMIYEHLAWIQATRRKYQQLEDTLAFPPYVFRDGGSLLFLGETAHLILGAGQNRYERTESGYRIELTTPKRASEEEVMQALSRYLKQVIKVLIADILSTFTPHLRAPYTRWQLSGTKRNWGLCTSRQTMRFSWRLVFVPPALIRYVVAHELAHLVFHNHSSDFWTECERLDPEMQQHREALKRYYFDFLPPLS